MSNFAPASIVASFEKDSSMAKLVDGLAKEGTFTIRNVKSEDEQAAYDSVVSAQAKFETLLATDLKNGEIESVVAVIHTPRPCNPLSYKQNNRSVILEELLKNGAIVACVYSDRNVLGRKEVPEGITPEEYARASARYNGLQRQYANLEDYPVQDPDGSLSTYMSGASYLIKTKDGSEYFYSMNSYQMQTIGASATRDWAVWSSEVPSAKSEWNDNMKADVWKRRQHLKLFLQLEGISLDEIRTSAGAFRKAAPSPQP